MKYINKFIAAGLGFALVFTGTSFVQGMFTSRAVQENVVTIQKPNIKVDTSKRVYFYGKAPGAKKFNQLYIPVIIEGIDSNKLNITAKVQVIGNSTPIPIDEITIGKGVHPAQNGYPDDTKTDCIIINSPENLDFGTKENYNVTVTVTIKGDTKPIFNETYGVEKGNNGGDFTGDTGKWGQYITLVAPYVKVIQDEEFPIGKEENNEEIQIDNEEEVVLPIGPEVVKPPKKEEVVPNEPEVVEPPEEEVAPIKPDIITPSKEEIEIQE